MRRNIQEFIGVDYGSARVGIARGNSAARLAEPLTTVAAGTALDAIKRMAEQNGASGIVVGLPRSLEGNDTQQTRLVRGWIKEAKRFINLPFYCQDEALTSAAAATQQAPDIDAAAAAAILQDFLDTPEDERVRC